MVISTSDLPVLETGEIVPAVEVVFVMTTTGDIFIRGVLGGDSEMVARGMLVPGAVEAVCARSVVGEAVVCVAVVVCRAAVDVAAGVEVTAVVVSAAGLDVCAVVERSVEVVPRAVVVAGVEEVSAGV